ncbi:hypothetical protein QJS10_CPA03g01329 [Acorus calamus]|uniref:Uncharacterized protein n=1 Tax=Acorus calamus TaxID=4465 RepID=A0AAV9F5J7_ACOCL|nr:hypothetical protein QJS10_CPA03g01329 [Acorus calamus]
MSPLYSTLTVHSGNVHFINKSSNNKKRNKGDERVAVCRGGSEEDRVRLLFVEVDLKKIVFRVIERARVSTSPDQYVFWIKLVGPLID